GQNPQGQKRRTPSVVPRLTTPKKTPFFNGSFSILPKIHRKLAFLRVVSRAEFCDKAAKYPYS
ncbi:hypothetical protein, partial [Escherichia coli]|uniref:hypothetical protein n=1 Tax=Escherichia coli TaxID=562 RepID=UPI001BAE9096